jgi:hypothetical protein
VQPLAVEKDYWICEVLRTIVAAHREAVVFKGGTSLEKLRIIQRFSEDLDLLVVGEYPSENAAKRALKAMLDTAASTTGGKCTDRKSGGDIGTRYSKAYLELPLEHSDLSGGLADPKSVLIELGQTGGPKPARNATVESLLSRELKGAVEGEWDDLTPFAVTILHPGRTLIEKLLRVNNFVVDSTRRDTPHGWPRIGRQFYDLWALLGDSSVTELLSDTVQVGEILQSVFEVSEHFGADQPVPQGASRHQRRSTPRVNSRQVCARNTTRPWVSSTTAQIRQHRRRPGPGAFLRGAAEPAALMRERGQVGRARLLHRRPRRCRFRTGG